MKQLTEHPDNIMLQLKCVSIFKNHVCFSLSPVPLIQNVFTQPYQNGAGQE
jgi:hypothetical protein